MTTTASAPADFRAALDTLDLVRPRPEIELGELPAPGRLAPFSHALSASLVDDSRPHAASGRLILLYDPNGVAAWEGTLRVVMFLTAGIDEDIARDVLLPEVAWSWLGECLGERDANHTALGGTVTATSSTRFGDLAGPERTDDLEIRASWTSTDHRADRHLGAFVDVLAIAAGLPPEGVTAIGPFHPPNVR